MKKKYPIFSFVKNTLVKGTNWRSAPKKNKDNNKISKVLFLIVFFSIVSLAFNHNLFRKFYNILKYDYEARIAKTYGFCSGESIGFIQMIKDKHPINTNPSIINFEVNPSSEWAIFSNNFDENDGSNIIFLNYRENFKLIFKKYKNLFRIQNNYQNTDIISKIIFDVRDSSIDLNNNIIIYKIIENEEKKIIYRKKIIGDVAKNNTIDINFKTQELSSRRFPIFIEIENLEKNKLNSISSISLILKSSYLIKDYKIIEKRGNCYYVTN